MKELQLESINNEFEFVGTDISHEAVRKANEHKRIIAKINEEVESWELKLSFIQDDIIESRLVDEDCLFDVVCDRGLKCVNIYIQTVLVNGD